MVNEVRPSTLTASLADEKANQAVGGAEFENPLEGSEKQEGVVATNSS